MNHSSIITQVSRDDTRISDYQSTEKANGLQIRIDQINNNVSPSNVTTTVSVVKCGTNPIQEPNAITNSEVSVRTAASQKKYRRFLRAALCCFGTRKSSEHKLSAVSSQTDGVSVSNQSLNTQKPLLGPCRYPDGQRKCMIIDLDETLVHSSFKPINNADFVVPVEIDGTTHQVYVLKRPYVDEFLKRMGELYECVLFTASLSKYADPVADLLDIHGTFQARLFRESCVFHRGNYVKDLNKIGRELKKIIIVDNSPASYLFHPDNAVPVSSWFDDQSDTELKDLVPFFEKLSTIDNVYKVLCNSKHPYNSMYQAHLKNASRSNLTNSPTPPCISDISTESSSESPTVIFTSTTNSASCQSLPSTSTSIVILPLPVVSS